MKIGIQKTVDVEAKTLRICLKVRDEFSATVHDQDGIELGGQSDGYVPDFMPHGDYVMLDVDLESGRITNWQPPTAEQIQAFIAGDE